ncbi:hypothetical protein BDQ12DRAFT_716164 [Crucibulum laeve]|uniref:DUF6533 domain-containing protein n=1 Tax=Crucibulum laeve TaxID=68775 RepID=A0A5C3LKV4_9AGAR|nr:hypothetical protein BDQ12DRAFT_716164 [Crucibulum laeve]
MIMDTAQLGHSVRHAHSIVLSSALFSRNYSSCAALSVLICEYIANFKDEYTYFWSKGIRAPGSIKWLYLFSRYFPLFAHAVNLGFSTTSLSQLPVDREICQTWFYALMGGSYALLVALDIVLMMRVYALYLQDKRVAVMFAVLLVLEGAVGIVYGSRSINTMPFNEICEGTSSPTELISFLCCVTLTQTAIWTMTLSKRRVVPGQPHPLVRLLLRDGTWAWAIICGVFISQAPYSLSSKIIRVDIGFMWPTVMLSLAACKIIINMQKLRMKTDSGDFNRGSEIFLTSNIGSTRHSVVRPSSV